MKDINRIFLTKTIVDLMGREYNMPFIKFLFDDETLNSFNEYLDDADEVNRSKILQSINYLRQIKNDKDNGVDDIYITVHDSKRFFHLLEKLVSAYSAKEGHSLINHYNFIRSIWLRMGVSDIDNVERFLEKQITFIYNESNFSTHRDVKKIDDEKTLVYYVSENEDWFETNKNIFFSLVSNNDDIYENSYEYDFPAIHFALAKINGKKTCFIYGIQNLPCCHSHDEDTRNNLQDIRKKLRNKNVSADFIIGMSLFLDYLYDSGVTEIEIPTLQVFNYQYHECLSKSISDCVSGYTDEDIAEIEDLMKCGCLCDKVTDYLHTMSMVERFVDKEDLISYNKSERFIDLFMELMEKNSNIELICEPFIQGENMKIRINGKSNLLDDYKTKKRTL